MKNQYKWKTLDIAKAPLEPATLKFIQENLTDKNLDAFIAQIQKEEPDF
ncbi:MAG: hypothetical protein HWD61_08765 [Parachlamydiaceae bacterium]|nr:MAG: hypothetical protein HWD61_08765 [Parachlamydiaceae bacterium]